MPSFQPFLDALKVLADKIAKGSPLNSKQWALVDPAIKERSFFSSTVEDTRFLQRGKDFIDDYLKNTVETITNVNTGEKTTAIKAGGRAEFVRRMREFQIKEGMAQPWDFRGDQTDIQDITKLSRLNLIFDTQVRQANGFGKYKQGQDPVMRDAFPAARFIRHSGARIKRPIHQANENEVRLKNDTRFWADQMNSGDIGGFNVPYPPFGFNSYMDMENVSRRQAEKLGLLKKGERVEGGEDLTLNDRLKASLGGLSPRMRALMLKRLKSGGVETKVKDGFVEVVPKASSKESFEDEIKRRLKEAEAQVKAREEELDAWLLAETDKIHAFKKAIYDKRYRGGGSIADFKKDQRKLSAMRRKARGVYSEKDVLWADALALPENQRGKVTITKGKPMKNTPKEKGVQIVEKIFHKDNMPTIKFTGTAERGYHINRNGYGEVKVPSDTIRVVVHEIAHQIEVKDPAVLKLTTDFLKKRAGNEKLKRLSFLTKNPDYKYHEVAFEDKFYDRGGSHYMGKKYTNFRATEILTMGVERILKDPVTFMKKDPDYFWLIIKIMRRQF